MADPAFWDSDTGKLTITATLVDGTPVNLTGTASRVVKVRARSTGTVTAPTVTDTNLAAGIVTATITTLGAGIYEAILRVTDGSGNVTTYPSAEVDPPHFEVKADMDA